MSTPTDDEVIVHDEPQPTTTLLETEPTPAMPKELPPDTGPEHDDMKTNSDANQKVEQNNEIESGAPPVVTANPVGPSMTTAVPVPPSIRVAEGVPPDSGRDARIAQRKGRIELNRLAKIRPELTEDNTARRKGKTDAENKELGKAKMQINQSKRQIENVKRDGTDSVTDVRVGVIARESTRRQDESRKTDIWQKKKNDVARKGEEAHTDIQAMWESAMAIKGPHALNEMLIRQREACSLLIASKNKLIAEYTAELKNKDDDYVKELKRQAEEIDSLLQRMDTEYKKYQQTLRGELEQIERAFMEERTELIDSNVKELESLFSQRRLNEQKYMEERAERIEEHIKLLESLRVHDAEEYNLVKIKLETDVQVLEQQLQQMRATYQLNTEKLDYNFQVLKKRDDENTVTMNQQKRKVTRVTDILNSLKAKFNKQEKMFQQEYFVLTEDYKRITEQFKELQKKYHHFQITDNKKFRDVWNMNEEIARELMRKVLLADRIIYEQQLGLSWQSPSEDLFKNSGPGVFSNDDTVESSPGKLIARSPVSNPALPAIPRGDETGEDGPSGYGGQIMDKLKEYKGFNKTLRKMLEMLCNEVGFLVEEKLNKLLTPLQKDEQSLMKLDSIFKALGVETIEDIDKLSSYFIIQSQDATAASSDKRSDTPEDGPFAAPASQLIHPNDVVKAIRKFIEEHRSELQQSSTVVNLEQAEAAESALENEEMQPSADTPVHGQKSRTELQREYWEQMAGIIDEKGYRVWDGVYASMNRYNQTLTERWTLTQEINEISQQNEELKSLLRQYMAAKVNDELEIPPTKIMLAQAGIGMNGTRAATSVKTSEGVSVGRG